ncbi:19867_t:CDS:2 [Racocetra fulgida]|uniref:19867_t:CDS:1 n=1 Tax=Racocetra fulgida TaxID=60492 RepID=A0A9N8ZA76_9GLOM|nr:19867_t:CDS:2 [Racocetra fulgida]
MCSSIIFLQVSIWGENARWKIDLVLLPDEETESQNQTIEDMINSTNSTVGHHSPVSENATSSSRAIYDSSSMLQLNPKTEDDVLCESNPQSFSMLDDDSVDKLDIEDAKRMLRDVMLHIRAYETMLERSTREFGLKEKEKSSKHAVEIQLLQEDLRILSRKLKESNAQLIESRAKQASLQQEQEACQIVEYVPQQQTNGYLTYNFPYVRKIPQTTHINQPLVIHNQIQSTTNQQIIPSLYSAQSVRNHSFTSSPNQQDLNGSVFSQYSVSQNDSDRVAYSAYSFRQPTANLMPIAYPMQLDGHVMNMPTEISSYSPIQTNVPAGSTSYSAMRPNDHTGLDNLSLAAELILSSAVSSNVSKDQHTSQNTHPLSSARVLSNTREGISQITEQSQPDTSMSMGINTPQKDSDAIRLPEDFSTPSINCKNEAPVTGRTYLVHDPEINGTSASLRSFMSASESIKTNKVDLKCEGTLNEHDEQSMRSSSPVTESHEDEPTVNDADLDGDCDSMDTDENIHEGGEEGVNNNDVTSSHEESDDAPNPSPKRPTPLKRVPPVQIF